MFAHERQKEILKWINVKSRAEFMELEAAFSFSPATLRRDLAVLESRHQIIRIHGGMLAANASLGEPDLGCGGLVLVLRGPQEPRDLVVGDGGQFLSINNSDRSGCPHQARRMSWPGYRNITRQEWPRH